MPSVLESARGFARRSWNDDAPLTATAALMLGALAACSVGLLVDPRLVLDAPVWLKPAKFAASIAVYCLTLAWLFGQLGPFVRTRRLVGRFTAIAMLIEMAIISLQAARGTTSHFNVSTPLDAALFGIMGVTIVLQTVASVAVAVALFRHRFRDGALGWAARLGMVLTIAGAALGGAMTRPTSAQLATAHAGRMTVSGAHTVGAPDGGPGLPVTGWSREHGDLRVPHFLGLHALQVLPLLALGLRRARVTEPRRVRAVFVLAASYAGLVGMTLARALHGQPLLDYQPSSLAAVIGWLALTGLGVRRALAPAAPSARSAVAAS